MLPLIDIGKSTNSIFPRPAIKTYPEINFQSVFEMLCIILPNCSGASHAWPPFTDTGTFIANQLFQYNI